MAGRFRGNSSVPDIQRVRADGSSTKTRVNDSLEEKIKARTAKNSAYQKYKDQLNEFFDGKRELPQNLKEMLATRPGAEDHGYASDEEAADAADAAAFKKAQADRQKAKNGRGKSAKNGTEKTDAKSKGPRRRIAARGDARTQHVNALRATSSPREAETVIDAMRSEGFSLPLEVDLLSKALGHKSEDVFTEALRGLNQVGISSETPGANLLKGRIANVALLASSSETRDLCTELQGRLAG